MKILLLMLIGFSSKAQLPKGFPSPFSTSWYRVGFMQSDSGIINASRDTSFLPRFIGTEILWAHAGVDTSKWIFNGIKWVKEAGISLSSISATGPIQYNPSTGVISCPSCGTGSGGINSLNTLTASSQTFSVGTGGTDFDISSSGSIHTFNIPTGSSVNRGLISTSDWSNFNGKQPILNGTGFVKAIGTTISYDNTTYYPASNPNTFIPLTALSALPPLLYNNSTGVFSADTSTGGPHLATQNFVLAHQTSGTITGAGSLAPLFTTSVSSNTLVFTISNAAPNTIYSNLTGSSGAPSFSTPTATNLNAWFGATILSNALTSAHIFVGTGANVAANVPVSGDMSLANTGAFTIINNAVTYAKFQAAAGQGLMGATGAGNFGLITLGTNLSMTGSVLNASGGGSCAGCLINTNNLSDVSNVPTSQNNLGLVSLTETGIGTLYNVNNWPDTLDFRSNGGISMSESGGKIVTSTNGPSLTSYISLFGEQVYPQWFMSADIKITDISGGSYGIGVGVSSDVSAVPDDNVFAALATTTGTSPSIAINNSSGNITTGTGPNFSLNDVMRITANFKDSVFTMTIQNVTTGSSVVTITHTYTAGGSPSLPTFGHFAIYDFGGTHEIESLTVSSNAVKNCNLLVLGNSVSQYYFTNSIAGGYTYQLNSNFPSVSNFSGSGGSTIELEKSIRAILKYSPKQVLMASPAQNQLRAGASLTQAAATYDSVHNSLTAAGINVYDCVFPEDSTAGGIGQTLWNAYVKTKYAATYINTYDSLSTAGVLKPSYSHGDGVHLNQAGDDKVYQTIIASNKIKNVTPYAAQIAATDSYIRQSRDSSFLDTANAIKLIQRHSAGLTGYKPTGPNFQANNFVLQDFAIGNGFVNYGTVVTGSGLTHNYNGPGAGFQFDIGQALIHTELGGSINTLATAIYPFKADSAGTVDIGGNVSPSPGNHTGAIVSVSANNVIAKNSSGISIINLGLSDNIYLFNSTAGTTDRGVISAQFSNDINGGSFISQKSRGTITSPVVVQSGDAIGGLQAEGFDGTSYQNAGMVGFFANGSIATGSIPTDLVIKTGSGSPTGGIEKLRISSSGLYTIPSSSFATGTTTDSVIVETTSSGVMTLKKVAQSSISGGVNIYNTDGSLTADRTLTTNSHSLTIAGSTGVGTGLVISSAFYLSNSGISDANLTIDDSKSYYDLPNISANRTITLPNPAALNDLGRILIIHSPAASFIWSFATTVQWPDGATGIVNLKANTFYTLMATAGGWTAINVSSDADRLRSEYTISTPSTGGTVALTSNKMNIINPSGSLATLTLTFPAGTKGDVIKIKFDQSVAAVTYSGSTVAGQITAPVLGAYLEFTWDSVSSTWF